MTNYELMLVASAERADQLLARIEKALKELSAEAVKVERLGKKQLAYPIRKQAEGIYFLLGFDAESDAIKPLWDKMRLEQEDLLRYLLIRRDNEPKIKKRKKAAAAGAEVLPEEKKETKPKVTVVTKAKVSAKVEKKKVEKVQEVREVQKVRKVSKVKKTTKAKKK